MLRYGPEYLYYLDASRFTDMRVSNRALTLRALRNVWRDTDVGAKVKHWLHGSGRGMSVLRCVVSEFDCPFFCCYIMVEYEKDLSVLVQRLDGQPLPELGPSLVVREICLSFVFCRGFRLLGT